MRSFKRMEHTAEDVTDAISFADGIDTDVVFRIKKVDFLEPDNTDDNLKLHFEYDILRGTPENLKIFEHNVGDLIVDIIQEQIRSHNPEDKDYAYTGGIGDIDED